MAPRTAFGRSARRTVRILLWGFPPAFRRRFGSDMAAAFDGRLRDVEPRGPVAVLTLLGRTAADLMLAAAGEWLGPTRWTAADDTEAGTTRGGRGSMVDALRQDLRFAARALGRRPAFTLVAVATLALGIGANTAVFSVVDGVLLSPLPFPDPDRLVMVWAHEEEEPEGRDAMSLPNLRDVDALPSVRSVEGYQATTATLTGGDRTDVVPAARVTGGLLSVMDVAPAVGRDLRRDETGPDAPRRAVVSWELWQERFQGRPDVVGSTLEISEVAHEVVGIAPRGFGFPDGARLWVGERNAGSEGCGRDCHTLRAVARLSGAASVEGASEELGVLASTLSETYPESNFGTRFRAERLSDYVVGDVRAGLWMVLAAVGLVLLIACANVANLLLVRASNRRTEVAVRAALGAGRRRLAGQVMAESALLATAGTLLGTALAVGGIEGLSALAADIVPRMDEVRLDRTALTFTGVTGALVTLLFGLAPALQSARTPLAEGLGSSGRGGSTRREARSRGMLVTAQVALSLVLLVGAGLLLRSFQRLYAVDLGYDTREVIRFRTVLPAARYPDLEDVSGFYRQLEGRVAALPGVEGVGFGFGTPLGRGNATVELRVEGRPDPERGRETYASVKPVSAGYLDVLRIPLSRGRGLRPSDDAGSPPVAVVNETFVRETFPGEDPIGQRVTLSLDLGYTPSDRLWEIVGVVADIRARGPRTDPVAEIYIPHAQFGPGFVDVMVRAAPGVAGLLPAIRADVRALDPNVPLRQVGTLREAVDEQTAPTRLYLMLVAAFAGLAVFLSAVGLYAVVAYLVARRTREIGVRVALGAPRGRVVRLVLAEGLRPAGWGLLLGLAAAGAGASLVEGVLFQVEPRDPAVFASVTVLLLGVVVVATLVPAGRATRVDPTEALRVE